MSLSEIINIVDGILINNKKANKIKNIKFDSRKIEKNDLYIAIIGNNKDGHDFIDDAINNGSSVIIVSKNIEKKYKVTIIKVENTLEALKKLAIYKRDKYKGKVIAITGSTGKTTTKEMLTSILKSKYNVLSNDGNKNNIYGLSETIFNLKNDIEVLVVELGMNHKGEIETLSKICKPNISIITNIGSSHIGNLKNKKNIFKAKMEIIKGMTKGKLIINSDNKYLKKVKKIKNIEVIKCGIKKGDLYCLNYNNFADKSEFITNDNQKYIINIPGMHYINNALLAIMASLKMDINYNDIKKAINNYSSYDRRYKIYKKNNITLIDDSYNSSYESLKANLSTLNKEDKKLLIIGDILELGKKTKKIHKKIGKLLKIDNADIIVVGENMKILSKKYKHFNSSKDVTEYLKDKDLEGYKILVKASNAVKLNIVSDYLKEKFDME